MKKILIFLALSFGLISCVPAQIKVKDLSTITVPTFGQSFLPYNPYYNYRNGVQFRVTKGGNTGRADTYTVSPTVSPKVEAEY